MREKLKIREFFIGIRTTTKSLEVPLEQNEISINESRQTLKIRFKPSLNEFMIEIRNKKGLTFGYVVDQQNFVSILAYLYKSLTTRDINNQIVLAKSGWIIRGPDLSQCEKTAFSVSKDHSTGSAIIYGPPGVDGFSISDILSFLETCSDKFRLARIHSIP